MKRVSFCSALFLCLIAITPAAIAEPTTTPKEPNKQPWGGLSMGIGLSLTHDLGWNSRVSKAQVVNGIVRVDEEKNDLARLMLEMHYFFVQEKGFNLPPKAWGHGPFVAIQPSNDKIIDAIAIGWMIGFRNFTSNEMGQAVFAATSWNFGVGFIVDANSKILGDGIHANQPLPVGETAVRLKDTSQGGVMFITSFSFN